MRDYRTYPGSFISVPRVPYRDKETKGKRQREIQKSKGVGGERGQTEERKRKGKVRDVGEEMEGKRDRGL